MVSLPNYCIRHQRINGILRWRFPLAASLASLFRPELLIRVFLNNNRDSHGQRCSHCLWLIGCETIEVVLGISSHRLLLPDWCVITRAASETTKRKKRRPFFSMYKARKVQGLLVGVYFKSQKIDWGKDSPSYGKVKNLVFTGAQYNREVKTGFPTARQQSKRMRPCKGLSHGLKTFPPNVSAMPHLVAAAWWITIRQRSLFLFALKPHPPTPIWT